MRLLVTLTSMLAAAPLLLLANTGIAVPGRTGGFGGPTCHACHSGAALNAAGGELSLTGLPERFVPGEIYRVRIELKRVDLARGGFSIASRFASGALVRRQAGLWQAPDQRVSFYSDPQTNVQYPQHSPEGTRTDTPGLLTWEVAWRAPADGEPVQFNLAATMSNNDGSPLGDVVYTREVTVPPLSR